MSPAEVSFLERAVVQLLFVSARTFSLEGLRDQLRELLRSHPEATVRAAASVGGFELVQVLLKASGRLEKLGLCLDLRGGTVRLATTRVEAPALRDYFALLREELSHPSAAAGGHEDGNPEAGPLGEGALEVLACVAFQQPVGQWEINACFGGTDKRTVVRRLQHLGLLDCRRAPGGGGGSGGGIGIGAGRTLWVTTPEFLRRFGLQDVGELRRHLDEQTRDESLPLAGRPALPALNSQRRDIPPPIGDHVHTGPSIDRS